MGRHTQQEVTATGLRNEKWHTTHPRHIHFTTLMIRRADQPHTVKRNGTKWGFGPLYCSRVFLLGFGRFSSNKHNRIHECTSKCHSINLEWKKTSFFFCFLNGILLLDSSELWVNQYTMSGLCRADRSRIHLHVRCQWGQLITMCFNRCQGGLQWLMLLLVIYSCCHPA